MVDAECYRRLRTRALRRVRRADEAEDLVQETLLAALQAGRSDLRWLLGVLENQAAMLARGAARRRRREGSVAAEADGANAGADDHDRSDPAPLLRRLPPAARRVAVLALHGLSAEDIRWILRLTPAAFRQRLGTIRKTLRELPAESKAEAAALAYLRDPARAAELQFGLLRRALLAGMRGAPALGSHDGDGHLLLIRSAHVLAPDGN